MMTRTLFSALLSLSLLHPLLTHSSAAAEQEPPLIPLKDFFRNPEKTRYQLSPDGKHLAFLQPWENRLNVHVQKIGGDEVTRVTSAKDRDIAGFFWANNQRIVYLQDSGGDENFRLFAVDLDGTNQKDLTPFEKVTVQMIDDLENEPDFALIGLNKRDKTIFDAYRLNIVTGELEVVVENPGNYSGYVTDHDGKIRIATTTDGVNTSILYRRTEDGEFEKVLTTDFRVSVEPLFFTYDNKQLYAASNRGRDKSAIVLLDPETCEEKQLIYQHPEVDVSRLLRSDKRKKITGVAFMTAKRGYHFLDEQREEIQKFLESKLPGVEVSISDQSKDETKYLVHTYSDKTLGAYYFYDHEKRALSKLADISPWLDETQMADIKPITYTSRDGLTINGYLTLPRGREPRNLPVVINPHGGPWARDHWGFNREVQFLANRGYAVLQMNFRGSTGYGRQFWEASFKEWGKSMQDDITDGVKWLIDEGIANPEKVGIYGGSYGGYATLAGLAFTPDLYACGVDYVGVSNLLTFMKSIPPYWEPFLEMMYAMVGHPERDEELMRAASPVFHVDKIKAPLFIAQGANDPRVVKSESDQMVEALTKRNIEVPYMVKENEGHGFQNEENRFEFYRAMEQFLAKHLGGRKEDVPPILN